MIDWQSWRIGAGADDIAYLLAFHWSEAAQLRLARPLFKRYYDRLLEFGVKNYTWADFVLDYEASIYRLLGVLFRANAENWERIKRGLRALSNKLE